MKVSFPMNRVMHEGLLPVNRAMYEGLLSHDRAMFEGPLTSSASSSLWIFLPLSNLEHRWEQ